MTFTVEIPDNAKDIKVQVLCDGKKCFYGNPRYNPGHWNGLYGGTHYGQYFDMENIDRVIAMTEVASVLKEHGIRYSIERFKRMYRITISEKDYFNMDESLHARLCGINCHHDGI